MQSITTSLTPKGQITIPKYLRLHFKISAFDKLSFVKAADHIKIYPKSLDILDIAPLNKAPKGKDALKARDYMQTHYSRV